MEHISNAQDSGARKVIIIGAGCTGCALAQGLKEAGTPYVVYEARGTSKPAREWNMGLHWAVPALKSLLPKSLFDRIQSTQVDPNYPTGPGETLPFMNGKTGNALGILTADNLYRVHRGRLQASLSEGLDVRHGKILQNVTYSKDGLTITPIFTDGTTDTGSLLVGSDGPKSTVRTLLLGPEKAKATTLNYASTMCFTSYTAAQARFLRTHPHHPLFQVAPHPAGVFAVLGLHNAPSPSPPEDWTFFHYISYAEPAGIPNTNTKAEHIEYQKKLAVDFADPIRSAFEWMPDDNQSVWYGKLNHWDPGEEGHKWSNHKGLISLAGDAAHPMTFQRGQGLNHAITDALKLCEAVTKIWRPREGLVTEERAGAIDEYEEEMIERGGAEVRLSYQNTVMVHDWEKVLQSPVLNQGLRRGA